MRTKPKQLLENEFVEQLKSIDYKKVNLAVKVALLINLITRLELHKTRAFTSKELKKVLNILSKGSVFEKTKTLCEKQHILKTSLNYDDLESFKFKCPCLEEQIKIAKFLSALDKKITLLNQQIEHTKTYKKGLLQQMFV